MTTRPAGAAALEVAQSDAPLVSPPRTIRLDLSLSPREVVDRVCRHPGVCLAIGDEDGEPEAFELPRDVRFVVCDLGTSGFKARCPMRANVAGSPVLVVDVARRPWGCALRARLEMGREIGRATIVALCALLAFSAVALAARSLWLPLVVLGLVGASLIDLTGDRQRRRSASELHRRLQDLLGELFARFTVPARPGSDGPYRDPDAWIARDRRARGVETAQA